MSWYGNLSMADQAIANQIASDYASELFEKTLDQLTREESQQVDTLARYAFLRCYLPG